jgi:hypothetical protein
MVTKIHAQTKNFSIGILKLLSGIIRFEKWPLGQKIEIIMW